MLHEYYTSCSSLIDLFMCLCFYLIVILRREGREKPTTIRKVVQVFQLTAREEFDTQMHRCHMGSPSCVDRISYLAIRNAQIGKGLPFMCGQHLIPSNKRCTDTSWASFHVRTTLDNLTIIEW